MKLLSYITFICLVVMLAACGNSSEQTQESAEQDSTQTAENEADTQTNDQPEEDTANDDANQQVTTGTFLGIEQGDYFYFKIKSDAGEELSLMVLQNDDTYSKIEAAPDKYIGKKVKVYWTNTQENIPEAGGAMEVSKYIKAEILE